MPKLVIESNGFYSCDGEGKCGGVEYRGLKELKETFNCECCKQFIKEQKIKVIDKRMTLNKWVKDES